MRLPQLGLPIGLALTWQQRRKKRETDSEILNLRLVSGGNRIQSIVWKGISANQVRPEYPNWA